MEVHFTLNSGLPKCRYCIVSPIFLKLYPAQNRGHYIIISCENYLVAYYWLLFSAYALATPTENTDVHYNPRRPTPCRHVTPNVLIVLEMPIPLGTLRPHHCTGDTVSEIAETYNVPFDDLVGSQPRCEPELAHHRADAFIPDPSAPPPSPQPDAGTCSRHPKPPATPQRILACSALRSSIITRQPRLKIVSAKITFDENNNALAKVRPPSCLLDVIAQNTALPVLRLFSKHARKREPANSNPQRHAGGQAYLPPRSTTHLPRLIGTAKHAQVRGRFLCRLNQTPQPCLGRGGV